MNSSRTSYNDSLKRTSQIGNEATTHPPRKVSIWVKLFVAFHVIAITVWAIPNPPNPLPKELSSKTRLKLNAASLGTMLSSLQRDAHIEAVRINDGIRIYNLNELKSSPLKYYVLSTGFWQYWDMFAPNPADTDYYGTAIVIYKNGAEKTYQYPRMYKLSIPVKYEKERFRKFYERAHGDADQFLWPYFAQHIALIMDTNPKNPPVEVKLIRHWQVVSAPGKPQPKHYKHYQYFDYPVNQRRLSKDLGGFWK